MPNRLSLEIGGTKLQAALGTSRGEILELQRCPVPKGSSAKEIRKLIVDLVRALDIGRSTERVGIGFGGPVDNEKGRVVRSFHINDWDDFPLRAWAEEQFRLPCVIENDTNCGALAEASIGAGSGAGVVFYTNIGSGIGGGLVINGKLYSRPFGSAEIGHTKLWDQGQGRHVIVEELCSGWAMGRMARERLSSGRLSGILALTGGKVDEITAEYIGFCASEGDPESQALITEVADNFAIALCNVIALLNPDRIIVGGGVSLMGELFFSILRSSIAREVFRPFADNYQIVPAALGENVVVVGALLI